MKRLIIVLFPLLFLLSACSTATEIDKLMIVSGMSIDKNDDDYNVITQVVNMKNSDQNELSPILLNTNGKTIVDALSKLPGLEGQRLYFTHSQVILLSSDYVKSEGVEHLINLINNEPRFRSSVNIAVAEEKASDVIATEPKTDPISCFSITDSIRESSKMLRTPDMPYYQFLNETLESGIDGILPLVSTKTEDDETELPQIGGTALFKGFNMVGGLSPEQTKYLLIARNSHPSGIYSTDEHSFLIDSGKTKIKVYNGKLTIEVKMELSLLEGELKSNDELSNIINDDCRNGIENIISLFKQLGCDPIGIGRYIKRYHTSLWKKTDPDKWEDYYSNLDIVVKVFTSIVPSSKLTGDK